MSELIRIRNTHLYPLLFFMSHIYIYISQLSCWETTIMFHYYSGYGSMSADFNSVFGPPAAANSGRKNRASAMGRRSRPIPLLLSSFHLYATLQQLISHMKQNLWRFQFNYQDIRLRAVLVMAVSYRAGLSWSTFSQK